MHTIHVWNLFLSCLVRWLRRCDEQLGVRALAFWSVWCRVTFCGETGTLPPEGKLQVYFIFFWLTLGKTIGRAGWFCLWKSVFLLSGSFAFRGGRNTAPLSFCFLSFDSEAKRSVCWCSQSCLLPRGPLVMAIPKTRLRAKIRADVHICIYKGVDRQSSIP